GALAADAAVGRRARRSGPQAEAAAIARDRRVECSGRGGSDQARPGRVGRPGQQRRDRSERSRMVGLDTKATEITRRGRTGRASRARRDRTAQPRGLLPELWQSSPLDLNLGLLENRNIIFKSLCSQPARTKPRLLASLARICLKLLDKSGVAWS